MAIQSMAGRQPVDIKQVDLHNARWSCSYRGMHKQTAGANYRQWRSRSPTSAHPEEHEFADAFSNSTNRIPP
jgi:hypothetical protein